MHAFFGADLIKQSAEPILTMNGHPSINELQRQDQSIRVIQDGNQITMVPSAQYRFAQVLVEMVVHVLLPTHATAGVVGLARVVVRVCCYSCCTEKNNTQRNPTNSKQRKTNRPNQPAQKAESFATMQHTDLTSTIRTWSTAP